MKWKVSTIILAAALVIISCGSEAAEASREEEPFKMAYLDEAYASWHEDFELYVDEETDVEYIIMAKEGAYAITPRYKRDGSIYVRRLKKE